MLCCIVRIELASSTSHLEQYRSGIAGIWAAENARNGSVDCSVGLMVGPQKASRCLDDLTLE